MDISRILSPLPRSSTVARGGDHSSGTVVAGGLLHATRPHPADNGPGYRGIPRGLLALARGGVCHAPVVTNRAVRSYRTLSPLPAKAGGLLSVALSLARRKPVGVTHHRVLSCPDFPQQRELPRSPVHTSIVASTADTTSRTLRP